MSAASALREMYVVNDADNDDSWLERAIRSAIRELLRALEKEEPFLVKRWLQELQRIAQIEAVRRRVIEAVRITFQMGVHRILLRVQLRTMRYAMGRDRKLALWCVIAAGAAGLAMHQDKAGLAIFGTAVAVPVWLVTGVALDEINDAVNPTTA